MRQRIYLVVERADGRDSTAEIEGDRITEPMIDAAEDLLETVSTGERPPIKGLYELCANAFGTSRDDAKERILAASYGMSGAKIEARSKSRGEILGRLAATRRERNEARAEVVAWMEAEGLSSDMRQNRQNEQAPAWDRFTRAEIAYGYAVRALEAWLDAQEGPP